MLQGKRGRFSTSSARMHPRDQTSSAAPRVTPCPATTCMDATLHGDCMQNMTDCIGLHGKAGTGRGKRGAVHRIGLAQGFPSSLPARRPLLGLVNEGGRCHTSGAL